MEYPKLAVALLLVAGCFGLSGPTWAGPPGPEWDLKGLRLGLPVEVLLAAAPGLKCDTKPHDTGLVYCQDRQASLGGERAFLTVKLLDGEAVYIALENLTYAQMTAAVPTLLEKFGTPAFSESIAGDLRELRRVRTVRRTRYVWRGADDVAAIASPFDWTDERRGTTYSSISLMQEEKQKQWGVRYNARERATDL